jgi:hypothetical protein
MRFNRVFQFPFRYKNKNTLQQEVKVFSLHLKVFRHQVFDSNTPQQCPLSICQCLNFLLLGRFHRIKSKLGLYHARSLSESSRIWMNDHFV